MKIRGTARNGWAFPLDVVDSYTANMICKKVGCFKLLNAMCTVLFPMIYHTLFSYQWIIIIFFLCSLNLYLSVMEVRNEEPTGGQAGGDAEE